MKARDRLTRDRVVEAALHVMDTEGLDAVSMRRVAREVGVEAMSLYRHVRDKDDLLHAMCDRVMGGFDFPHDSGDWIQRCKAAARSWRKLLKEHPDMMRLFAETHGPAPSSPDAIRPTEFALQLLHEGGLSDRDTVMAFNVFGGYIQGFVMMEGGAIKGRGYEDHFAAHEQVAAGIPDEFPILRALARYFAECDPDEQFEFGLDLLLRGIQAKGGATTSQV